jgi:hypothetical protein
MAYTEISTIPVMFKAKAAMQRKPTAYAPGHNYAYSRSEVARTK